MRSPRAPGGAAAASEPGSEPGSGPGSGSASLLARSPALRRSALAAGAAAAGGSPGGGAATGSDTVESPDQRRLEHVDNVVSALVTPPPAPARPGKRPPDTALPPGDAPPPARRARRLSLASVNLGEGEEALPEGIPGLEDLRAGLAAGADGEEAPAAPGGAPAPAAGGGAGALEEERGEGEADGASKLELELDENEEPACAQCGEWGCAGTPDGACIEARLAAFDNCAAFGPCLGLTRTERWERAAKLGLRPPAWAKELIGGAGAGAGAGPARPLRDKNVWEDAFRM